MRIQIKEVKNRTKEFMGENKEEIIGGVLGGALGICMAYISYKQGINNLESALKNVALENPGIDLVKGLTKVKDEYRL